ncbi:MAG: hypothetical protein OEY50_08470 [Nitrospinota bacterium]|nr:hypothetical protein [Nitrospinota bacterium]MDH5756254.1 hypothetical protein [Nitrospinota bacterium]
MIIHRYSEYEEPERPPFTIEDLIRSITEMMMRGGMKFDEALRKMLEHGLPINLFLRDDALDHILDDHIEQVKNAKEGLAREYDYPGYLDKLRERFNRHANNLADLTRQNPRFFETLKEAARNKSASIITELWWMADRAGDERLTGELGGAKLLVEELDEAEEFNAVAGKEFSGAKGLDWEKAREIRGKYEALDRLQQELEEAREKGNLFGVNEERLKEALGEQAYAQFARAREELMDKLAERLKASGQVEVEEDSGLFKLTPAAARKVGETTLAEIYMNLKNDGAGGHYTTGPGDGALVQVKTKPFEYGDSISNMDVPASMINALVRGGCAFPIRLRTEDMEIHETRGVARNVVCVLLDMSGSMSRFGRFYNAKKMALALDSLVRSQYPEDSVNFVGFATYARRIALSSILELSPEPITFWGGGVSMKVEGSRAHAVLSDTHRGERGNEYIPRYFTNIQKGMELARMSLTRQQGLNKQIIMITDGAPTAWYEGGDLLLSYPPVERGYAATLREARACARAGISINVFMLGSDFDTGYYGEDRFLNRFMETTRGRIFYPNPDSLTEYVLVDYMSQRRRIVDF